eukprot:COSAG06_NODE_335_length_17284_cov_12.707594_3_plen_30_part_00
MIEALDQLVEMAWTEEAKDCARCGLTRPD